LVIDFARLGLVAGTVAFLGTLGGMAMLVWFLCAQKRRYRRRRVQEGELATAGATMYLEELRRLQATSSEESRLPALMGGELAVGPEALAWTPAPRYAKRGVQRLAWRWADVDHVEVQKERSAIRCDVMAVVLKTGNDAIIYVTAPRTVEDSIRALGVTLHAQAS
jgi:hypothetical protein